MSNLLDQIVLRDLSVDRFKRRNKPSPFLALLVAGFLFLLIYFININRRFDYTREFNRLEIVRIEAELLDSPEYYNALWRKIYYQASLDEKKDLLQALEEKGQLTKNRAI